MSERPVEIEEVIARDLLCMRCGYNLRTLGRKAACPGCGLEVAHSLAFEGSQPPLAAGCRWVAIGAMVMVVLGVLNFCVHLSGNITYETLGKDVWNRIFDPTVAAVRVMDVGLLVFAVICFARSDLSPGILRQPSPLSILLVLALLGISVSTLALAGINLLEFPLAVPLTLGLVRMRYFLFFVQTSAHLPLLICGWLFLRNLARRPEFADFRAWVAALLGMNLLFWAAFGLLEIYFLAIFFFVVSRPASASVWNLARTLDWVDLASDLPEVLFWWLLARRAWRLRAAAG